MKQRRVSASRSGMEERKFRSEDCLSEYGIEWKSCESIFGCCYEKGNQELVVDRDGVVDGEEWFISRSRVEDWSMLRLNRKRYVVAAILDP